MLCLRGVHRPFGAGRAMTPVSRGVPVAAGVVDPPAGGGVDVCARASAAAATESADACAAALLAASSARAIFSLPICVKPSTRPIPVGSMPYSAGNTHVVRVPDATQNAMSVARNSVRGDAVAGVEGVLFTRSLAFAENFAVFACYFIPKVSDPHFDA